MATSVTAVTGLADLLDRQVRTRPHAPALTFGDGQLPLSYEELDALAEREAERIAAAGVRAGEVLGLVAGNSAEFVGALLGAGRAGVVPAPLDPGLSESELRARCVVLGARGVLHGDMIGVGSIPVRPRVRPDDALVLFTAGATGRARMVPLTHGNVVAAVNTVCATYALGPEDATVAVMPFFHGHGLFASLLATLASGGCVLLPSRPPVGGGFSAEALWGDLRAVGASWFTAVPVIHEALLERSEAGDIPVPPPLRFVRSCGAPLNAATQRALERMFGAPVLSAYGMTEAAHQIASEPLPRDGALKHGTVGRATGVRVRVVDREGRVCAAGVRGEVWVRGPAVAGVGGGWLRTGDLGWLDEDGYLSLAGRIESLIVRRGRVISPEYVEDVLAGCPSVVEAAVFAVGGEGLGAAVVVRGEECVGVDDVLRYCRGRLASVAVPDRVVVVSALPRTAQGGLDRSTVAARYA
ncbi:MULTISPECIES: AMP-binding protein [unclassified Streptomyces]|uniref:AMP-binding protein n=1 Tax=unclassified Streptomyces TaxID=2593676 RepID=UPI00278C052B|nr:MULTISPECIES: AMP-binding protein [unclassified Streptomyces]